MKKMILAVTLLFVAGSAFAGEAGEGATYLKYFGYFLAVSIAALGGTLGQSRAATAALEGIARNPNAADKVFTPMILSFAFMESLVIFTLISTFIIG
jgi:F-type H+-transporting ATPase subunit c